MASNNDDRPFQLSTSVLLSNKERLTEAFLRDFFIEFELRYGNFSSLPADRSIQDHFALAEAKLNECSLLLGHRYNALVKDFIRLQFEKYLNSKYGHIMVEMEDDATLARKYRECFNTFMYDEESVHFNTLNKALIKDIDKRHYFILMYYAMCTNKRQMSDNCLCLSTVGASTCGKTILLEAPLQEIAHNYTNSAGVGRFSTNNKSVLLVHDVPMKVLTTGQDADVLKCLARTESINVKIHSTVQAMAPIFVFVTSNQLLFNHNFQVPEREGNNFRRFYPTNVVPTSKLFDSDIKAIQNRYLELMVRQKPMIPLDCLPKSGSFKRDHLIVGLFCDIMDVLSLYNKDSYGSTYVYLYCLMSLCKNLHMMPPEQQNELKERIYCLITHYELTEFEQRQCLAFL